MFDRSVGCLLALTLFGNVLIASDPSDEKITQAVAAISAVGPHGKGHQEAVAAMKVLNNASAKQIPLILSKITDDNRLAVNWLRSAVIKISASSDGMPLPQIRGYFDDRSGSQLGRLLAFNLLTDNDQALKEKLIPTLIDDPSLPLRYLAVEDLIAKSESAPKSDALGMLATALKQARDVNQVVNIAEQLGNQGVSVDLQKQLGFINQWHLVGNFDNTDEQGYEKVFGPEKDLQQIDLQQVYDDTKSGSEGRWEPYNTVDSQGLVDLNRVVGKIKDAIVYAYATYNSDSEQMADIRIGCINAHKVWVNGEPVMANEIYHNGISPDKFVGRAKLKKGANSILVKVCQNNQTEGWAQRWMFQLRVCDSTGKSFATQSTANE